MNKLTVVEYDTKEVPPSPIKKGKERVLGSIFPVKL